MCRNGWVPTDPNSPDEKYAEHAREDCESGVVSDVVVLLQRIKEADLADICRK